ncbi:MAG: AAA family ATPase [Fibrobacter sp.]|nr:AAA family ATPase [Fibrobacter sp.]
MKRNEKIVSDSAKNSDDCAVYEYNVTKDLCTVKEPETSPLKVLEPLQHDEEYRNILSKIQNGCKVLFITGKAGTGKSTFIRYYTNFVDLSVPVLAPTGVAALNVGGQTIHSFFHFPPRVINNEDIKPLKNRGIFLSLKTLILDEVSMIRADLMDAIDQALRKNTGNYVVPFGGIQMVFVGDLLQLPPVVASAPEIKYLYRKYKSPYFLSAHCLQEAPPVVIELKKVHRQQDEFFINLLSKIRAGEDLIHTIGLINALCLDCDLKSSDAIILTPTNAAAELINDSRLAEIDGNEHTYEGVVLGRFSLDDNRLPSPKILKLKNGCRIMFTKNHPDRKWVNGTLGTVVECCSRYILVETPNGVYHVNRDIWESIQYNYDNKTGKIKAETVGTYIQFPVTLAWAITIHKSQGKTFDKVIIDPGNGAFAEGQIYVALSRCRTLEGISLMKPIRLADIKVDAVIKEFYENLQLKI